MNRLYNMTKEDNIFFAKRKIIDNIYKSANLEGIAVTFVRPEERIEFFEIFRRITITFLRER